jgi:hypothetical protein
MAAIGMAAKGRPGCTTGARSRTRRRRLPLEKADIVAASAAHEEADRAKITTVLRLAVQPWRACCGITACSGCRASNGLASIQSLLRECADGVE